MSRKITFRKVKLQPEKKKFEFTWDKIALLILVGAFVLFYSLNALFDEAYLRNIVGSAVSEEQEQENSATADIRFAIEVTNATHLDSGKKFIKDITKEIKYSDGKWSPEISNNEYVRVVFEQPLDSNKDIKIFSRILSGNPRIEVYEKNSDFVITEFTLLINNNYNKILLTNLQNPQDTFDLKILNGSVEFEHVIDPETKEEKQ